MKYQLSVIKYPSGRYGFVGNVPTKLAYANKDGSELTAMQALQLSMASNPGMLAKGRAFETEAEAWEAHAMLTQGTVSK